MNETAEVGASLLALHETITAGYIVISIILSSIVACTLIGNLFVIAAILIDKNLQTTANQLVLSLAVADLMVACLVMPLGAYNDINQGWWLGKGVCEFWTSADVLCCTASILNLLAIALDRYWAVTNVDYIYKRTRRRVSLMILCAWAVGAVVSLAPIFGWKDPDFARRVLDEHKCLVSQDVGYQIFATISTFYAPLVLLLALYWRIFQVARKRIRYKPGGRKSIKSRASDGTTNLMDKSGKSLPTRAHNSNENEQSRSCFVAIDGAQVGRGVATAASEESFAQVRGEPGASAVRCASHVESDCSGYNGDGAGGRASLCDARHPSENKARHGQPQSDESATATKLTANVDSGASARSKAREFNLTSTTPSPTLTNDKFRLAALARAAAPKRAPVGQCNERPATRSSLVAPTENRLHARQTFIERDDESSSGGCGGGGGGGVERDNGSGGRAAREVAATGERGKGARMNEREICLRRSDGDSGGRQATPGSTAQVVQDQADQNVGVRDHFLRTGSDACIATTIAATEGDDNKTNELAPPRPQLVRTVRAATMIELGDKLTSVSGKRRTLKASRVRDPNDEDNAADDDNTNDHNQRQDASAAPAARPSNLRHAHHRSLHLVQELDRQAATGRQGVNCSLAQLDAQLLASMASDNLTPTTLGDSNYSPPTSSQVSECHACCCCAGDDDDDDEADHTQSETEEGNEYGSDKNHHCLRGAGALPASWHSDKRLASATRDKPGLLDGQMGVASPPPAKSSIDQIRELLASQGFKEPIPLRRRSRSRRRTRIHRKDSASDHWLGSASSSSSSSQSPSSSDSTPSSRSMLAAASTARLEPLQLIDGLDAFQESSFLTRQQAISELAQTALASRADTMGDEGEQPAGHEAHDNLFDKSGRVDLRGLPAARATTTGERIHLARAMTMTTAPTKTTKTTTATRLTVTNNYKADCHRQPDGWSTGPRESPSVAATRRAKFLKSRPSMAVAPSARVAPVASLTGVTRGDGAGSLVSSSSRTTLSIRSRFRALGQLVSFVQTSRQFNSTSSAGSESAPATSQSGDDETAHETADKCRPTDAIGRSHHHGPDDHQAIDPLGQWTSSGDADQVDKNAGEQKQQAAPTTTTTTTDLRGHRDDNMDRVNGGLAVINSIRLPGGGQVAGGVSTKLTNLPRSQGRAKVVTLSSLASQPTMVPKQPRQSAAQQRRQNMEIKREKKAAKTLAIITGVFVCCWLPFFLNAIVMPICGLACTPSDLILSVLLWLGYLNSLLNPIIYTIFSPDFRRAFHRLLCWAPRPGRNKDADGPAAHKQGANGGGCRARNSPETPPVQAPSASAVHHAGARHRVAAMG